MHVVPVQLPLICALSKIRIAVPSDLRPVEARQNILMAVQELGSRFPHGLPKLNPVKDMGIEDPELVELLQKFCDELKNRSRVLKKLGHIDADGVVQLKGRAACLIDTGDELLVTVLMFNGTFNNLDPHQVAALASCFIPGDKSNEQIHLRTELAKPLQQLQDSAQRIAEIQLECKLEVNMDEYVESTVRPYLMDVIYCWSKGATFAEIIEMTDIFEAEYHTAC
ncbi:Superkiller viralicidic activity 2-like [Thalictrum thalictroides]|uniref:Superkiller viralicidic activity 2-like n=1 Tax=Thalictrum thalictroides TaxID=46969 RepID=A0A7J6X467_THATH|nr:Superkiller viralicidic activity 2-like [Thalictrum thalictroides]